MRPTEDKMKFISLRSSGKSYRAIAQEIGISKDTCSRWDAELRAEIEALKSEQLEELYEQYHMTRTARISQLGESVKTIDKTLETIGLENANPERLLELKLKYLLALKEEYVPTRTPRNTQLSPETDHMKQALNSLVDLLERIRAGEVTEEQASKESAVITSIVKAIEVRDVKSKLELLERVLKEERQ